MTAPWKVRTWIVLLEAFQMFEMLNYEYFRKFLPWFFNILSTVIILVLTNYQYRLRCRKGLQLSAENWLSSSVVPWPQGDLRATSGRPANVEITAINFSKQIRSIFWIQIRRAGAYLKFKPAFVQIIRAVLLLYVPISNIDLKFGL